MFIVLTCEFLCNGDPNNVEEWELEDKIGWSFETEGEAIDAIFRRFEHVNEKAVDGIFTGNCKDGDLGHWQVVKVENIKTSDKCPTEWWAF